jgi:hypothetical protein
MKKRIIITVIALVIVAAVIVALDTVDVIGIIKRIHGGG